MLPVRFNIFSFCTLADESTSKTVGPDAPYVVKVEPSENGPLFSELKFYMRAAKPEMIQKWTSSHKLKYLGVPRYWGSGLHDKNGKRSIGKSQSVTKSNYYRFLLWISSESITLLSFFQVFLVDYGLAYRYCPEGVHKEYKEDPKKCHNGTIEFTSIDAHLGVNPSRRGDLQILGFCMIQWLCGKLPWEDKLTDPEYVANSKRRLCDEIPALMEACFPGKKKPDGIANYMEAISELGYAAKPPYQQLRDILLRGLKSLGVKDDGKLDFSVAQNGDVPVKVRKRKLPKASEEEDEAEPREVKKRAPRGRPPKSPTSSPKTPPKGRGRGRGKKQ
ncbi:hypothetical protein GDO78_010401 [Eleutherodactylus coqui]|uniref:Protein kinase domain-containing protein n=1 Tax=Eleutherodactylus coqui TaxID=57060 RepID=A0A8J6K6M9_ELECQ|nr:hypothetical protein GDO78_010401 [Eleutherodactylus coqui]